MNYLGIDPGASGGIAVIGERGATAYAMPTTDRDVYELLRDLARDGAVAVLEQVGVVPGNGSLGYFKLGRSYGFIQGCLAALDIPFLEVVPRRWQGALEQDADVVWLLYRDEVYGKKADNEGKAELHMAKQRNGPTGLVRLVYVAPECRFESAY